MICSYETWHQYHTHFSFRLGPLDILVELLEDVVASFQTCGVVGQINLRAIEIGGKIYNKEHYLKIFQTAYSYGGICSKLIPNA